MWPVIWQVGPLTIYSFGAMVALGCMVGAWLMAREMERRGFDGEVAWSITVWSTFIGFATSAVWYYVQHHFWELLASPFGTIAESVRGMAEQYQSAPGGMVARLRATFGVFGSGFVWYGGLIGGVLTGTWIIRRHALPWLSVVDCAAPSLALAQGFGRIGCQLAGDGDWGTVTDVPWAMSYPRAIVGWPPLDAHGVPYPADVTVHPAPLYELAACLAIFAFLWSKRRQPIPPGTLFWWYLALSGAARFVIEFWRVNPTVAFGLTAAQVFSLLLVAVGAWQLLAGRGAAAPSPTAARATQPARR